MFKNQNWTKTTCKTKEKADGALRRAFRQIEPDGEYNSPSFAWAWANISGLLTQQLTVEVFEN